MSTAPTVPLIPGEIHARALALGYVASLNAEVTAGHGPTGRIAWGIYAVKESQGFTDLVAIRSGTHKPRNEYGWIWAAMRDALDDIEAAVNEQITKVNE